MKSTFYRFKYMRRNIISIPVIFFILLLIVNVIAFTWFILLLSLVTFLITIYFFIKFGLSIMLEKIVINENGIEWVFKKKQKAIFFWEDIVDVIEIRFWVITSFDLVLSDKICQKYNFCTFRFDFNKEILNIIKSSCTNTTLLSKINEINPKY